VLETPVPSPEAPEYSSDDLPENNDPNRSQQEPPPPLPVEREDSGYYGSREVSDSESSSSVEKFSISFSISDIETLEYPEDSEDLPTLHSKIPFPRDLDTNPDEYTYIEGDTLNFKDKSLHCGIPFKTQYEGVKLFTNNFQDCNAISDPTFTGLLLKAHESDAGKICEEILQKHQDEGQVSTRERHFLLQNKDKFYADKFYEFNQNQAANLKAVPAEMNGLMGWAEIQQTSYMNDCLDCNTTNRHHGKHLCEYRNMNGPVDHALPRNNGSWKAMVIGVFTLLNLPWHTSPFLLNFGFLDDSDYDWDMHFPFEMEVDFRATKLGRAINERLRVLNHRQSVPVIIEFAWAKVKDKENFAVSFYNFLRVIKDLQKGFLPPIIVAMGITMPTRNCTGNSYAKSKRENCKQLSSARAIAYCLGVPLLEIIIQRQPVIKNPRLEWNNSGEWGMNPLFNKHFLPTNEFHLRLATVLARTIDKLDNICIPKNMSTVETLDIGELWT